MSIVGAERKRGVKVHVSHLEGMAAVGLVEKYWLEDCDYPRAKRVYAVTVTGELLSTKCVDERAAKKIALYMAEATRLSKTLVQGTVTEDREEVEA
ncbi:MAG: hypothetical protein DSY37_03725 [Hyperthermus sp.]|nr:MAG: hypothetical protein DSY37_03725 [Hyperthermus sp.]